MPLRHAMLFTLDFSSAKAIKLAEKEVFELTEKYNKEKEENRTEQCKTSREEISIVVQSEIEEVDAWIVTCKSDKDELCKNCLLIVVYQVRVALYLYNLLVSISVSWKSTRSFHHSDRSLWTNLVFTFYV